jgi:hypothetical protein
VWQRTSQLFKQQAACSGLSPFCDFRPVVIEGAYREAVVYRYLVANMFHHL